MVRGVEEKRRPKLAARQLLVRGFGARAMQMLTVVLAMMVVTIKEIVYLSLSLAGLCCNKKRKKEKNKVEDGNVARRKIY